MERYQDLQVEAHLFEVMAASPTTTSYLSSSIRGAPEVGYAARRVRGAVYRESGWGGSWKDGVFSYHHYHSTAHEVLGVVRGSTRIPFFGGEAGVTVEVGRGRGAYTCWGGTL